jgi:hypothetical protein
MGPRALVAIAGAAVLCGAGVTYAAAANTGPADRTQSAPSLRWTPCETDPAAECATLEVPVDWAAAGGDRTRLRLTRVKATDQARRIGVLISPPAQDLRKLSPALAARFDLVTYTERLPGPARDAECSLPMDVTYVPQNEQEFRQLFTANRTAFERCERTYGTGWRRLDSVSKARDVDAIRAALGEPRISFLNTSPTDIVGQMYAELFPGRIRAMVLDGAPDHSVGTADEYFTEGAGAVEDTFNAFAEWCERAEECAFRGMDVRQFYSGLRETTEKGGFKDLRGFPFDLVRLGKSVELGLARPYFGWLENAERFWDVHQRNQIGLARARTDRPQGAGRPGTGVAKPAVYTGDPAALPDNGSRAGPCQDWNPTVDSYADVRRIRQKMAQAAPVVTINSMQWEAAMYCVGWPFEVPNPPHRLNIDQRLPVLVSYAAYNIMQPTEWGTAVAEQIPGAKRLVYEGPGTNTYSFSRCARDAIDTFLITLRAPAESTCRATQP